MANDKLTTRSPRAIVPRGEELQDMIRIAELVFKAGVLPQGIGNKEQAFAIMLYGWELGISPWIAWKGIYPTTSKDKPGTQMGMSADLMLGIAKGRIPGFNHGQSVEYDEKGAVMAATFWSERPGVDRLVTRMTLKEAALAGLTSKGTWMKYTDKMLLAACKRSNIRTMAADVLAGAYTPEELGGEDPPPDETKYLADPKNILLEENTNTNNTIDAECVDITLTHKEEER
jgi:hypothetical protein